MIDKTIAKVRALNNQYPFKDIVLELYDPIKEYTRKRIGEQKQLECNLVYNEDKLEMLFWALGLMSLEWTLGILRKKTEEGHCNVHRKQAGDFCQQASDFHRKLYEQCKRTFNEVLEAHGKI